jgi:hypothetical protein
LVLLSEFLLPLLEFMLSLLLQPLSPEFLACLQAARLLAPGISRLWHDSPS